MAKFIKILLIIILTVSLQGCSNSTSAPKQQTPSAPVATQTSDNYEMDISIRKIKKAMEVSTEKATEVYSVFSAIGVPFLQDYYMIDKDCYQITAPALPGEKWEAIIVVYTTPSKSVKKIIFRNDTLYENGSLYSTLKGSILSDSQKQTYIYKAKQAVKKALKNPDNAEFIKGYWVTKDADIIKVIGTVKAKNSYGEFVSQKFFVEMDKNYNVKSITSEFL